MALTDLMTTAPSSTALGNQYTRDALARHKQEGLELAVRARWIALAVIAVLLPILNFQWDILWAEFCLLMIALNGWFLRRVGRVGRSGRELGFIAFDVILMTFVLLFPNPFSDEIWPTAVIYEFQTFLYLFVILMLGALSYSWRTILAMGHWCASLWLIGSAILWWLGERVPEISERINSAFPNDPALRQLLDPNNINWDRRVQEVVVFLICAYTLALMVRRFERLVLGNAGLERARSNLSRYFSPTMVEELSNNDDPLKQIRTQNVAVLFVDIVGFTAWSAQRDPRDVITLLREFHGRMEAAVFAHGGTLDKYLGDGLMATFGTPVAGEVDASQSLRCARAMMETMTIWNQERLSQGEVPINASFGLHYGPVVMGDIGANRLEFSVIGNTVNIASRLEAMTRTLGAELVISDGFLRQVIDEAGPKDPAVQGLVKYDDQAIKGLDQRQTVWALAR